MEADIHILQCGEMNLFPSCESEVAHLLGAGSCISTPEAFPCRDKNGIVYKSLYLMAL